MLRSQAVVDFGEPLQTVEFPLPVPKGREVLIRTTFAGMCHSDVHLADGYFDMGGGAKMPVREKRPFTLGHEIEGDVTAVGPDVPSSIAIGSPFAVFPWLGCYESGCAYCGAGNANLCVSPHSTKFADGKSIYGGYGSHVLVPDYKWLLKTSDVLAPGLGAVYMCSGLTAFSAIKKTLPLPGGDRASAADLLIIGLGGLGFQAVQMAHALLGGWPVVADIDEAKRRVAEQLGCTAYDPREAKAMVRAVKAGSTGNDGVHAAIDFVGAESTFQLALGATRAGGKVVIVGLFGGQAKCPLPMIPLRQKAILGSMTGTFDEAQDMLNMLRERKVDPPPHHFRSIHEANAALDDLRSGKIVGRCILRHDWDMAKI